MSIKKKKKGGKKLAAQDLQIQILRFLLAHPKKKYTARLIIDHLQIENTKDSVEHALRQLAKVGSANVTPDNKFGAALDHLTVEDVEEAQLVENQEVFSKKSTPTPKPRNLETPKPSPPKPKLIEGRMDMTRTGAGYVVSDLLDADVYIPVKYMGGALHGDIVRVALFAKRPPRGRSRTQSEPRREGEIVEIVRRSTEHFIGTIRKSRKYALFLPDNPLMPTDIYVPLEECEKARDGDKVVVRVTDWMQGKNRVPMGKVTQVLGAVGGHDFEMKKILINQGFELEHSPEAQAEAEHIPETVSPQEIERRRDFRDILTFTIDPEDAKDFDDALSIRALEDGKLEIGVHIADVTHYLKPGTPLDREAFQRSTSVYLVDRVCPMLPEKLSNNLCSLVPHADRLTFSAVFVFDKKEKITGRWFGKTVIHSAKRFSYEEAQTVLENNPSSALLTLDIYPQLDWALKTLDRIAKKMRAEREKNGAIGFETEEVRFRLELDGTPIEAFVKERKDAHLLIEDFMLLANKEVALYIDQKSEKSQEVPFVYRIHDLPDMEKVAEFARFAAVLGYKMRIDTPKHIAESYNNLMKAVQKDERLKPLEPLAIRTMAKAVYSPNNIGHYGLGFSHYAHFTSPIRRYSDVLAHRILERNLNGNVWRLDKTKLEEQCKHISAQEKKAADAERESVKYKQAELTQRQIGQSFTGIVTGMIERGFFVELPGSKAEGMVSFRDLDDTYILMDGNLSARGRHYGKTFKMGDKVEVVVTAVDLQKRQIELFLAEE